MIEWPSELVGAIARRRAVLMIGAGVSKNSTNSAGVRPKAWVEFLEHAVNGIDGPERLKREIRRLIKSGDLLTACDVIKDRMGDSDFFDLCTQEFLRPGYQPAEIHRHIHSLDLRIVVTPNFDVIYENYVNNIEGNVSVKTNQSSDLAGAVRSDDRMVFKIHGTIQDPPSMVFTRSDYAAARSKYPIPYHVFSSLMLTHTLLFVGCGLHDPNLALLMEDFRRSFEFGGHHYMTLPSSEKPHPAIASAYEKVRSLRFLHYDSAGNHAELTASLEALVSHVQQERGAIAQAMSW